MSHFEQPSQLHQELNPVLWEEKQLKKENILDEKTANEFNKILGE